MISLLLKVLLLAFHMLIEASLIYNILIIIYLQIIIHKRNMFCNSDLNISFVYLDYNFYTNLFMETYKQLVSFVRNNRL